MAITVNGNTISGDGVHYITTASQRESLNLQPGIRATRVQGQGVIYRARVFIDTPATDIVIDDPTIANDGNTGYCINVLGVSCWPALATVLSVKSLISGGSAKILDVFNLNPNGPGLYIPVRANHSLFETDQNSALIVNASAASGANPVYFTIRYIICATMHLH